VSVIKSIKLLSLLMAASALTGCFGRFSVAACEQPDRYQSAPEAGPVLVPDGLTPPDESRALQIPDVAPDPQSVEKRGDCLESPPEYFEGGLPT
jgi:hypothetical protein